MRKVLLIIFLAFTSISNISIAQNPKMIDSLEKVLKTNMPDTQRIKVYRKLSWEYQNLADLKRALINANKAVEYSLKSKNKYQIYRSYFVKGIVNRTSGKIANALSDFFESLKYIDPNNNKESDEGLIYINIAQTYSEHLGNHEKALEIFELAYQSAIKKKDTAATCNLLLNKLEYLRYAKKYQELDKLCIYLDSIKKQDYVPKNFKNQISNGVLESKINVCIDSKKYNDALILLEEQKKFIPIEFNHGILAIYHQKKASIFIALKNFDSAKHEIDSSINFCIEVNDRYTLIDDYLLLSDIFIYNGKFNDAKKILLKATYLAKIGGIRKSEISVLKKLATVYKKMNEPKLALEATERYIQLDDSLNNNRTQNTIADLQASAEREIKQKEIDVLNKDKKLQSIIRNSFIGGFIFILIIAIGVFRSLQQNRKAKAIIEKQKTEVEHQKHLVEEKNKEILDSIEYALRIQTAILPPHKIVRQYLENSFILYKPKDIVAGDFYWMETINDLVLFAACDCTGHGVPGAMVSVVCHNALNRAVREFGLTQPAVILDKTAEIVLENFSKSEEEIQDGMDISICALNTKTKTLEWAGANNPLWLISEGNLIETKADKQCIGYNENVKPFTNHQFNLQPDTSIYLFTDGFADQFGGQRERKLTKNKFKELLISIQHLPIQQQATELDNFITNYKQATEQTDDILVIGVMA